MKLIHKKVHINNAITLCLAARSLAKKEYDSINFVLCRVVLFVLSLHDRLKWKMLCNAERNASKTRKLEEA